MQTDVQIILLGESEVGKTSLLLRFVSGLFKDNLARTTIDSKKKKIKIKDMAVNLVLWDTAGQEMYNSLVRGYYRLADGVILVYDVQNADTFLKLSKWLVELKSFNENAEVLIAGNKSEDPNKKSVNVSMVKNFARTEEIGHVEVSAKSGGNVEFLFRHLVKKILAARGILTFSKSCVLERLAKTGEYISPQSVISEDTSSSSEGEKHLNKDNTSAESVTPESEKVSAQSHIDSKTFNNDIDSLTAATLSQEPEDMDCYIENTKLSEEKPTLTIPTTQIQEREVKGVNNLENAVIYEDKPTLTISATQLLEPGDKLVNNLAKAIIFEDKPTQTISATQLQESVDKLDSVASQESSKISPVPVEISAKGKEENSDTECAECALEFFETFPHERKMLLPPKRRDVIKLTETEVENDGESCCVI